MADAMKLGLVGAGTIAQTYLAVLKDNPDYVLAAIADTRAEAAQTAAEAVGGTAYASHAAMLAAESLDGIIVAAPPLFHRDIAIDALDAGVAVLCEKPLAIDSESAEAMIAAAERTGHVLTMASKFRFVDDVATAREMIARGEIGEVTLYENTFTGRVDMRARWNATREVSGGGVLIDNGTHSVDVMRYFLGPLAEVQAVEGRRTQGLDVDETVKIMLRSQEGVLGSVDLSWSMHKELTSFVDIYGTEGVIQVGWRGSRIKRAGQDWESFGTGYNKFTAFKNKLDNFAAAVRGDGELRVTTEDALASVRVIEAAYRSLESKSWVAVA